MDVADMTLRPVLGSYLPRARTGLYVLAGIRPHYEFNEDPRSAHSVTDRWMTSWGSSINVIVVERRLTVVCLRARARARARVI